MSIRLEIDNPNAFEEQLVAFVQKQKSHFQNVTADALSRFLTAFQIKQENMDIKHLPSSVDRYIGIVSEEEIDHDPKQSREDYLKKKYA